MHSIPTDNTPGLTMAEIEAILIVPNTPTLTQLDNTLRMFITFTGAYHGKSKHHLVEQRDESLRLARHLSPDFPRHATRHRDAAPLGAVHLPRRQDGGDHDGRRAGGQSRLPNQVIPCSLSRTLTHTSCTSSITSSRNTVIATLHCSSRTGNGPNCYRP